MISNTRIITYIEFIKTLTGSSVGNDVCTNTQWIENVSLITLHIKKVRKKRAIVNIYIYIYIYMQIFKIDLINYINSDMWISC